MSRHDNPLEKLPERHVWSGPDELRKLVTDMFKYYPHERPTAGGVITRLTTICTDAGLKVDGELDRKLCFN